MVSFSPLIDQLIASLRNLPGVGPKSAQRMAFHLLSRDRKGGLALAHALQLCMEHTTHCKRCRTFSETSLCLFCNHTRRDQTLLCIVGTPIDMIAVEQTGYRGLYFILHGHLSPIDGIGPSELGLDILKQRLMEEDIQEIILATNPTVEGEATAHYIAQLAKHSHINCSRIAHGVPLGSELEYIDGNTLAHAIAGREIINT